MLLSNLRWVLSNLFSAEADCGLKSNETLVKSTGTLELVESSKMFFTVTPQEFGSDHAALNISTAEDYNKDSVHSRIRNVREYGA